MSTGANASNSVYFETRQGDEIRINYEKNSGSRMNMDFVFHVSDGLNPEDVYDEFIRAGVERRLYTYEIATCPTSWCEGAFRSKKNRKPTADTSTFFDAEIQQAGTRLGDDIYSAVKDITLQWFDNVVSDGKAQMILTDSSTGFPDGICVMDSTGVCRDIPLVEFHSVSDNIFQVGIPNVSPTHPRYSAFVDAEDALASWIVANDRGPLECSSKTLVRGTGDDTIEVVTTTCHWSH